MTMDCAQRIRGGKGASPCKHLIRNDSQRIVIGSVIRNEVRSAGLLGGNVVDRTFRLGTGIRRQGLFSWKVCGNRREDRDLVAGLTVHHVERADRCMNILGRVNAPQNVNGPDRDGKNTLKFQSIGLYKSFEEDAARIVNDQSQTVPKSCRLQDTRYSGYMRNSGGADRRHMQPVKKFKPSGISSLNALVTKLLHCILA